MQLSCIPIKVTNTPLIMKELPIKPLTINEFNQEWKAHKRDKYKGIKLHVVSSFRLTKKLTKKEITTDMMHGIPTTKVKVVGSREVSDIKGLNKAIVAWLQLYTAPLKCAITNTSGKYIPNVGFVANKADRGRADITAEYQDMILSIETKQKNEMLLDSQHKYKSMAERQSFRKYVIVRSWEQFQSEMIAIFTARQR